MMRLIILSIVFFIGFGVALVIFRQFDIRKTNEVVAGVDEVRRFYYPSETVFAVEGGRVHLKFNSLYVRFFRGEVLFNAIFIPSSNSDQKNIRLSLKLSQDAFGRIVAEQSTPYEIASGEAVKCKTKMFQKFCGERLSETGGKIVAKQYFLEFYQITSGNEMLLGSIEVFLGPVHP